MHPLQENYDYLRLVAGPERVRHEPDYIKVGNGADAIRRIFNNVPLDKFELDKIDEFKIVAKKKKINVPAEWNDIDILKRLYNKKFDFEKTFEMVDKYHEWMNNPINKNPTDKVLNLLKDGTVYIYGRDYKLRPVIVFNLAQLDFDKIKEEEFYAAASIIMQIAQDYLFVPGKIENIVFLLDVRELSMMKLPLGAIKGWEAIGSACFPRFMHHTFVVGSSFTLKMSWKAVEAITDNRASKSELIGADELDKIRELVPPSQIQKKFGGTAPDLKVYFPPNGDFADSLRNARGGPEEALKPFKLPPPLQTPKLPMKSMASVSEDYFYYVQGGQDIPSWNSQGTGGFGSPIREFNSPVVRASQGRSMNGSNTNREEQEYNYRRTYEPGMNRRGDMTVSHNRGDAKSAFGPRGDMTVSHTTHHQRGSSTGMNNDHWHNSHIEPGKRSFRAQIFDPVKDAFLESMGDSRAMDKRIDDTIEVRFKDVRPSQNRGELSPANKHGYPLQYDQMHSQQSLSTRPDDSSQIDFNEDRLLYEIMRENNNFKHHHIPDETADEIPDERAHRMNERRTAPKLKQFVDASHSPSSDRKSHGHGNSYGTSIEIRTSQAPTPTASNFSPQKNVRNFEMAATREVEDNREVVKRNAPPSTRNTAGASPYRDNRDTGYSEQRFSGVVVQRGSGFGEQNGGNYYQQFGSGYVEQHSHPVEQRMYVEQRASGPVQQRGGSYVEKQTTYVVEQQKKSGFGEQQKKSGYVEQRHTDYVEERNDAYIVEQRGRNEVRMFDRENVREHEEERRHENGRGLEKWERKAYLRDDSLDGEDEKDNRSVFCGFCISSRKYRK